MAEEQREELFEARVAAARGEERAAAMADLVAELKAQLAETRKPWWRIVGALLVSGSLATVNTAANAQSKGMDLLSYCKIAIEMRDTPVDMGTGIKGITCSTYIVELVDGWIQHLPTQYGTEPNFGIPPSVAYDQFVNVYVRWAETHPERLHLDANHAVHEALAQAFPC